MLTLRGTAQARRGPQLQQLNIIADGSLLVRDGVVVEVGPTRRVENLADARHAVEVNATGRVVMPGFVDSHTHLLFPPPGSSKLDAEGGTRALRAISAIHLKSQARTYLQSMVRHGTTTAEVKTGCGRDESTELKILRVANELRHEPLHLLSSLLFGSGSGEKANEEPVWDWICERFLPKLRRRHLVQLRIWSPMPRKCRERRCGTFIWRDNWGCCVRCMRTRILPRAQYAWRWSTER